MLQKIFLLALALLLCGCSNAIYLKIDAINAPDYSSKQQSYELLSGNPNINNKELYFKEFSRFTHYALNQAGLKKANNDETSNQKIYFSFGINHGTTERHTYTTPIYGYVGGNSVTIKEETIDGGNINTSTTELYVPYSNQVVGRELRTRRTTTYQSYLRLEGRSNNPDAEQLWMITIEASSINNDLRLLIPAMLSKAQPYIGKNTNKIIQLKIRENSSEIQKIINDVNQ